MSHAFKFCPQCATPLSLISQLEDGGDKVRLRCTACDYTHWNNPTPVLVVRVESDAEAQEDPALEPFLELLRLDMSKHPRRIARFPSTLFKKARSLVKGVKADLDGPLTGED